MHEVNDPLITVTEAAEKIGVNRSTLFRQIKAGAVRSHEGKVRLSELLADRAANIDLTRSGRRSGRIDALESNATAPVASADVARVADATAPADATRPEPEEGDEPPVIVDGVAMAYAEARALKETYLARLKRLEFETKRGELGRVADFQARCTEILAIMRDALLAIPGECADRLSPPQVQYVRDKIYDAMEHLSDFGAYAEEQLATSRRGDSEDPEGD